MSELEQKEIIESTHILGYINHNDKGITYFDDDNEENSLIKNKIINIIIYTKIIDEKKEIIGLQYKVRNLYNGKDKIISHKCSEEFDDKQELEIKSNEYLKELILRFPIDGKNITQLGFLTSKNNKILVGEDNGELKIINMNKRNNIILGFYGYLKQNLNSFGCYYVAYDKYAASVLFKFFLLRYLVKKKDSFKKEYDEKYEQLPLEYKYIWRTINLPDNIYSFIIRFCL